MVKKSLVEQIAIEDDRHEVPYDWEFIIDPLINSINNESLNNIQDFYVELPSTTKTVTTRFFSSFPVLELSSNEESTERNYKLLSPREVGIKPIAVIGEPGIGKSTWISHFFKYSLRKYLENRKEGVKYYIYNHKTESGNPVGPFNKTEKLRNRISFELVKLLQKACEELSIDSRIFEIDLDTIDINTSFLKTSDSDRILDCVKSLRANNIGVWLVVDNLDEYPITEQREGFELANSVSQVYGIHSIVPIRPYSYPGVLERLEGTCVTLRAPELLEVLKRRVEYLKIYKKKLGFQTVLDRLKSTSIELSWTKGVLYNEKTLIDLYDKISLLLGGNKVLVKLLRAVRHNNIRKSLRDISHLLCSGHFAESTIGSLKEDDDTIFSNEEVITSYLRGPYNHHRGRTDEYLTSITNLFDLPNVSDISFLLGIRILQILNKHTSPDSINGMHFSALKNKLIYFEYPEEDIYSVTKFLLWRRLVKEVVRLENWKNVDSNLEETDQLIISSSGEYYMSYFLKKYSLRYCEAMADVTKFPSEFFIKKIKKTKSVYNVINNALTLCGIIERNLINEINRLSESEGKNGKMKIDEFFKELDHDDGFFYGIMTNIDSLIEKLLKDDKSEFGKELLQRSKDLLKTANTINSSKRVSLQE